MPASEKPLVRIAPNNPVFDLPVIVGIEEHLFEAAVLSQGESTRQQLAVFLHEKHLRTTDALKARAMPEPDSKGG